MALKTVDAQEKTVDAQEKTVDEQENRQEKCTVSACDARIETMFTGLEWVVSLRRFMDLVQRLQNRTTHTPHSLFGLR